MSKFKINPLVLAIAVAMPTTSYAQAQDEAIEEVVVSGFRASLANALNIKKEAVGAVDSIVAEDIGKFPDNNLADSMARLPGVNIDRTGGEGKTISVRGLSPDFSRVRINGMETIATGYNNKNRTFDFNIFASELFSRIDVHKTMSANLEEGSLGATVDMRTAHPLDTAENPLMVNVSGGYNDQSESFDPRFTVLGGWQNEEGTLGAALSVAASKRNIVQQGHNSGRWEANPISSTVPYTKIVTQVGSASTVLPGSPGYVQEKSIAAQTNHWKVVTPATTVLCTTSGGTATENCWNNYTYNQTSLAGVTTSKTAAALYVPSAADAALNNAVHPRFPRQMDREIDVERFGSTVSLQWKPTDGTSLTLDVLHADLGFDQTDINLTPISLSRTGATGRADTTVTNYVIDPATNAMVKADLAGVDVRSENFNAETQTVFDQYSLTFEHEFNDTMSIKSLLGTSRSKTDVAHESTMILEAFNQSMTYDYTGDKENPVLTYGFDTANPANWHISELRDRPTVTENSFDNASVDFKWGATDIFTLETGVSIKKFTFDILQYKRDTAVLNQSVTAAKAATATAPAVVAAPQGGTIDPTLVKTGCPITYADTSVSSDLGSVFTPSNGQNPFFLGSVNGIGGKLNFFNDTTCFPLAVNPSEDRSVEETDTGGYVQLDFKTEIANMPFRGDLGVRTVKTDLTSTSVAQTTSPTDSKVLINTDVTAERSYNDTLPSLNLALNPREDVTLRASWAKVMSRPSLGNLTPGGSLDNFNRKYTVGNPELNPFRATAIDLSAEWYFMDEGLISLALFQKDISSFPNKKITQKAFSELGLAASPSPAAATDLYTYTLTDNGEGGKLDGYEVQYQQPFAFGPDWLRHFGVKLNYTHVNSKVNIGTADAPVWAPLVGQSDQSYNGTLWYEGESGFSGRVSYTYRSQYLTTSNTASVAGPGYDQTLAVGAVDAAFGYKLNDNMSFSLDLINLNNIKETTVVSDYELVDTSLTSGRQVYLGMQYTF